MARIFHLGSKRSVARILMLGFKQPLATRTYILGCSFILAFTRIFDLGFKYEMARTLSLGFRQPLATRIFPMGFKYKVARIYLLGFKSMMARTHIVGFSSNMACVVRTIFVDFRLSLATRI